MHHNLQLEQFITAIRYRFALFVGQHHSVSTAEHVDRRLRQTYGIEHSGLNAMQNWLMVVRSMPDGETNVNGILRWTQTGEPDHETRFRGGGTGINGRARLMQMVQLKACCHHHHWQVVFVASVAKISARLNSITCLSVQHILPEITHRILSVTKYNILHRF